MFYYLRELLKRYEHILISLCIQYTAVSSEEKILMLDLLKLALNLPSNEINILVEFMHETEWNNFYSLNRNNTEWNIPERWMIHDL